MRASFFERPLEYRLEIDGDAWRQGDEISGSLEVCNRGEEDIEVPPFAIKLVYSSFKDVKSTEESPSELWEHKTFNKKWKLPVDGKKMIHWRFDLVSDCPITDKSGSLFLLYGREDATDNVGRINLNIELMPIVESFLQTFETQFKFRRKYAKYKRGMVEIKLDAPDTAEYAKLKQTLCLLRIQNKSFEIRYDFKMETLGREGNKLGIKKFKKQLAQKLKPEEYLLPGGFPNRKAFLTSLQEALDLVRSPFPKK